MPRALAMIGTLMPCSLMVGTCGKVVRRFSVSAAMGLTLPAVICSLTSCGCGMMICTLPANKLPMRSLTAGVGTKAHFAPVAL
jgi:hypothetical protein